MDGLIKTGEQILQWLQTGGIIGASIAFAIGAYYLMFGGHDGRPKAKGWFIGGAVGLIILLGAKALATSLSSNISF
jgi:hypothetical protein